AIAARSAPSTTASSTSRRSVEPRRSRARSYHASHGEADTTSIRTTKTPRHQGGLIARSAGISLVSWCLGGETRYPTRAARGEHLVPLRVLRVSVVRPLLRNTADGSAVAVGCVDRCGLRLNRYKGAAPRPMGPTVGADGAGGWPKSG